MTNSNAFTIGIWVLWAIATAVVLFFAVFHIFDGPPQSIMSRSTETLFAPLCMLLIGLSMWQENDRLRSLTATIALFSILLNIAFVWTSAARIAGDVTIVGATESYITEVIASIAGLAYLVYYLRRGSNSTAG